MKLTNTVAAATAAMISTSAMAADIAVIGGSIEDGFFNLIKKGIDDATLVVEANGGSVNYLRTQNYDNFGPDLVQLINTAVSQGVDGIARSAAGLACRCGVLRPQHHPSMELEC